MAAYGGGAGDWLQRGHKGISGVMGMFYISVEEVVTGVYMFTKSQQILHLRSVQRKFYLKKKTPQNLIRGNAKKVSKIFHYAGYIFKITYFLI